MFVDTNIWMRFLLNDHPSQSAAARRLVNRIESGEVPAWTTTVVVFELVYMLSGPATPDRDRSELVDALLTLLELDGLEIEEREVLADALRSYRDANIDFADAYHASVVRARGEPALWSFDRDFDRIAGVERYEPT